MLFGWKKVGPKLHFLATVLVAIGTSDLGLLDPVGQQLDADAAGLRDPGRRRVPGDRLLGGGLQPQLPLAAGAHAAGRLPDHGAGGRRGLGLAGAEDPQDGRAPQGWTASRVALRHGRRHVRRVAPLQLLAGDLVRRGGARTYQPAKLAAIEALLGDPRRPAAPHRRLARTASTQANHFEVSIPSVGSLDHRPARRDEVIQGLDSLRARGPAAGVHRLLGLPGHGGAGHADDRPGPVGRAGCCWRDEAVRAAAWFLRFAVAMGPAGFVAVLAGWIVAEVGRQPWVVYGVLRTADAVSPVTAGEVLDLAAGLHHRLRHRLHRRRPLHPAPDGRGAEGRDHGPSRRGAPRARLALAKAPEDVDGDLPGDPS